jgi:hypothetical protein
MPRSSTVLHVHVTSDDIAAGLAAREASTEDDPVWACPVARALTRDAGLEDPQVIPGGYRVVGTDYNWKLPWKAIQFVRRFDAGKPVEPFDFDWWPVN